ncbi:MAG: amylo-alpha-1,6-glucosidase [Tumebacillaceae bacterium]
MNNQVIKQNDVFFLTNAHGNVTTATDDILGVFTDDTRFLSEFAVEVENLEMVLLSSHVSEKYVGTVRLTNKEVVANGEVQVWRESIALERKRFIYNGVVYETISFRNYNTYPVHLELAIRAASDYAHMFTCRGYEDGPKGEYHPVGLTDSTARLGYTGQDKVVRNTDISFAPAPQDLQAADGTLNTRYAFDLAPQGSFEIAVTIVPELDGKRGEPTDRLLALQKVEESFAAWDAETTQVVTDNEAFNRLYNRSRHDMLALLTDLGDGRFPVAGVPIYAVPFGRDSLIAAWQTAAVQPEIMRGTLKTMARHQGTKIDAWRDEQPGKILHEIRYGELANLNVIPHAPYYGTIDATPLFLVLAAEYFYWTGDEAFLRELLPNIERALEWCDQYGDRDGDGYVEYYQESSKGCTNQGWKDSGDSLVHRNGELAEASIALSEVQGYVYDAKVRLASVFERLGHAEKATALREQAAALRTRYAQDFWMDDEKYVALALDKNKAQVGSVSSNPGHNLLSGLLTEEQAAHVAKRLLADDMFSGWGIRTLSANEKAYNPMSYHNGSVWPHDNSLIVMGLKRYGFHAEAERVMEGLLATAGHFAYDRLPELFCGYDTDEGHPVSYPVACSPQAWAAGTALTFVRVILGLMPDVPAGIVTIAPSLPKGIHHMEISKLRVGSGFLDLLIQKQGEHTTFKVLRNTSGLQIVAG